MEAYIIIALIVAAVVGGAIYVLKKDNTGINGTSGSDNDGPKNPNRN